jgi:hypothetical protein
MSKDVIDLQGKKVEGTEELVQFTDVSPFTVAKVYNDNILDNEYFVLFGKYRMTEKVFSTFEDAEAWSKEITYENIVALIGIFMAESENINLKPE